MIDGVKVKELKIIRDERGSIMHMLRNDSPEFSAFGEIYFSTINPGFVKGWHIHKKMALNYAVVKGAIKLVLYDGRAGSKTKGEIMEIPLGPKSYKLVTIPPMVWNGFECSGKEEAIVANCSTLPHDPEEIMRVDPFQNDIPYKWKAKKGR
ncbi:MAG: dTDP-4-dehydrorhamnose 3,5-epimerase family protein [Candidatus Micrarchaeota archaeon]|nr:dTDP-4-dehydrorhamnose 3,5-epimerase family protein [Candidatus Micrarchaeota archaeon]